MNADKLKGKSVLSSIFLGYFIVISHLLLVFIIGVAVVFFRGVLEYMLWILLGGLAIVLVSGYYFYRRIKKGAIDVKEILNNPAFRGRAMEVKLLGGVASLRIGQPVEQITAIPVDTEPPVRQLESPETLRMQELGRLVTMRENNLVTHDEYEQLKKDLLKSHKPGV